MMTSAQNLKVHEKETILKGNFAWLGFDRFKFSLLKSKFEKSGTELKFTFI